MKRRHYPWQVLGALAIAILICCLVPGCATTTEDGSKPSFADLDSMAERAIERLLEAKPDAKEVLDASPGWAVLDMRVAKIPFIGTGSGYGVVMDKRAGQPSYVRVSRFEVGGGLGAQHFKIVIAFDDEKLLDKAATGTWHYEANAQVTTDSEGITTRIGKGYRAYWLGEGGAVATVTVRIARSRPYQPD